MLVAVMRVDMHFLRKGYTLPELLVVMLIILILLGIGVPAMSQLIRRYQMSTTVSSFYTSLQLARSEAIRRGDRIDLMPVAGGKDWAQGWAVLQDKNGNRKVDEGDEVIFSHGPAPKNMVIHDRFSGSAPLYFAYNGSGYGRTHGSSQAVRAGSWTFLLGEESRKIIINFTGRPRLCDPVRDRADC
jgi:type IV fimbrial biogenesis protein FimT